MIARTTINYRLFESNDDDDDKNEEETSSVVELLQSKPSLAIPTHLLATLAQLEMIKAKLGIEALLQVYQSGGGVGGWGVGEYGAMVFGGVLTLKDALVLAACHGKAIEDARAQEEEEKKRRRTTIALTTTITTEENNNNNNYNNNKEEHVPRVSLVSNIISEEEEGKNGSTSTAAIAQNVSKAVSEALQGMRLNIPRLPIVSAAAARRYTSLQDIRDTLPEAVSLNDGGGGGGGGGGEEEDRRRLLSVLMLEGSSKTMEINVSLNYL
jgi:hypothetical protein